MLAVWVIGAIAALFAYTVWAEDERRLKRVLRKAPLRSIDHTPDGGYARYCGVVLPIANPLVAPLTGRACAYWRVIVEDPPGEEDHTEHIRREEGRDFSIRDATGTLLVTVAGARLALERDAKLSSGFMKDASPTLERFLAENGMSIRGLLFNSELRYSEAVIEAGECVSAAGFVSAEAGNYRAAPRRVLQAGKGLPVLITDDPRVAKKQ